MGCVSACENSCKHNEKIVVNDNLRHFCDNSRIKSIFSVDYIQTIKIVFYIASKHFARGITNIHYQAYEPDVLN